ncbi:enoyl-CoA hydratase-related protein, partial [Denitromonas sp.]|uniref:enoyl-CoA hydratase-related protein n=1 Tax=Denitromonas sp. TaxID=2734609 RepID=UPI002FDD3CF6
MAQDFETIALNIEDGVATLTLNRPDRLNSFTDAMHVEVRSALDLIRAGRADGSVRAMVLTGAGRGFCAGQDLSDRSVSAGDAAPD